MYDTNKKCPRLPAATITALTAATCGVLTEFVSFHPADLGHHLKLPGARQEVNEKDLTKACSRPITRVIVAHHVHRHGSPAVMSRRPERSHPPHALGAWGEEYAQARLEREGWRILERGYRLGRREVDVIVRRGDVLVFVEVKTRSDASYGTPQEAVTYRKRREIEDVARYYLVQHPPGDVEVRFDVIAIVADSGRRVSGYEHIEDAWRPEEPPL